jgi:hypothetical protein
MFFLLGFGQEETQAEGLEVVGGQVQGRGVGLSRAEGPQCPLCWRSHPEEGCPHASSVLSPSACCDRERQGLGKTVSHSVSQASGRQPPAPGHL